jgi:hypothetical protein
MRTLFALRFHHAKTVYSFLRIFFLAGFERAAASPVSRRPALDHVRYRKIYLDRHLAKNRRNGAPAML